MKTYILSIISVIVIALASFNNNDTVPTPATISVEEQWETASIYEISFSDECPMFRGKEVLLSVPLFDAVVAIITDNNTAYGDYAIEYKYVPYEDIYIANLIDEFVEL